MKHRIWPFVAALGAAWVVNAQAMDPSATLYGENFFAPLPDGFKMGAQNGQGRMAQMEFVPAAETVTDWTVMVTVTTVKGQTPVTPEAFSQGMAGGFQRVCAHGEGHKTGEGAINGYGYTEWMLTCDLNPQTGKPEFLVMRTFQGADAFFNVQYAFRAVPTDDRVSQASAYLATLWACDTRLPDRPCKSPR